MVKSLDAQIDDLTRILTNIRLNAVSAAYSKATNETISRVKTRVIERVSEIEKIPTANVRKRVFTQKSTIRTLNAKLTTYTRAIPVISLLRNKNPTTRRKRRIQAAGKLYQGAFIRNIKKRKNPHVFLREAKTQYPIELQKLEIEKTVRKITPVIIKRIVRDRYEDLLLHELNFQLDRYVK